MYKSSTFKYKFGSVAGQTEFYFLHFGNTFPLVAIFSNSVSVQQDNTKELEILAALSE